MPNIKGRPDAPLQMTNPVEHRRMIAERANSSLTLDGSRQMVYPLPLKSYTVAGVPDAGDWEGSIIYVSNESGGKTIAFSDGSDWRRAQDRAVIS